MPGYALKIDDIDDRGSRVPPTGSLPSRGDRGHGHHVMNATRGGGFAGSISRYAAPGFEHCHHRHDRRRAPLSNNGATLARAGPTACQPMR